MFPKESNPEPTEEQEQLNKSNMDNGPEKEPKTEKKVNFADDTLEEKNEGVKMEIKEEEIEEDKESPFISKKDEDEDIDIPKPKPKKKRQLSQKQLDSLALAREKSRIKRMKLAEARNAEKESKREATQKIREAKRKEKAKKKAEQLAEIEGYEEYKEKKYSFTKDELTAILDSTIDRHETKRRKRKEEDKMRQQPMVAQPYPYALPQVPLPPQAYHVMPHQAPYQPRQPYQPGQPGQPGQQQKPKKKHWKEMTRAELAQEEKDEELRKANEFMNQFLNIK